MGRHSKKFDDKEEFRKANLALTAFQRRHNIIRKDYELLLEITDSHQDENKKFNALYRASLKGFLSLIESDIFGLNSIDPYDGYDDRHSFVDKFKKTYKKVCQTWDKNEIIQEYLDSKYGLLKSIKSKRDKLVHPKTTEDIVIASSKAFIELKTAFEDYNKMLHSIMNNFFISIEVSNRDDIINLFKK